MLEALKISQDDLNRLNEERAAGRGSFDVALINAFLAADGSNRAKIAYMFPWLMRGRCYNYHSEEIVERDFECSLLSMRYCVRISESQAIHEWLFDMGNASASAGEFIRNIPSEIMILSLQSK